MRNLLLALMLTLGPTAIAQKGFQELETADIEVIKDTYSHSMSFGCADDNGELFPLQIRHEDEQTHCDCENGVLTGKVSGLHELTNIIYLKDTEDIVIILDKANSDLMKLDVYQNEDTRLVLITIREKSEDNKGKTRQLFLKELKI